MSEARKAADDWACYEQNCDGPVEDTFLAGARALLEWARSKSTMAYNGMDRLEGIKSECVSLSDLEAYFAEELK